MAKLERLQADEIAYGYQINRIVDALNGSRGITWAGVTSGIASLHGIMYGPFFDNVDVGAGSTRTKVRFWIPPAVDTLNRLYLSFALQPLRSAKQPTTTSGATGSGSGTTAAGSAHTHTTSGTSAAGSAHTHTEGGGAAHNHAMSGTSAAGAAHSHTENTAASYTQNATTATESTHTHGIGSIAAANESTHTHTINNESAHTHGIGSYVAANESAHTHGLGSISFTVPQFNLSDANTVVEVAGTMSQGVHVYVDGTDRTSALSGPWGVGTTIDVSSLDITTYLVAPVAGWHEIRMSSTALGGITTCLYLEGLVNNNV